MSAGTMSADSVERVVLKVDGMTCSHCAQTVNKALLSVPGVHAAQANAAAGIAEVERTGSATMEAMQAAIESAGYRLILERDTSRSGQRMTQRARRELWLLLWSTLWTLPVLIVHYGGFAHVGWTAWLVFACATVLQPTSAVTFYLGAWRSLRRGSTDMDVLVSIGVAAGYLYALLSTFAPQTFHGASMEFFEAATLLICFIRLGKWIELRSRASAACAMEALLDLAPPTGRRQDAAGQVHEVPAASIAIGDRLVVLPGDRFVVDGIVLEGNSAANEALISGEALPVAKSPGDRVVAGSVNEGGRLIFRATSVGADTTVARIVRMVERAQAEKAPIQRMADRLSNIFVPAVVLIAIASGVYWGAIAGEAMPRVLTHVIGVLVIACPCALGLAVPAAIMIGSSAGMRKGILVKNGAALEALSKLDVMVFDKTGTLTVGKPSLAAMQFTTGVSETEILPILHAIAAQSTHPLCRATVHAMQERGIARDWRPAHASEQSGRGVTYRMGDAQYAFGSEHLMGAGAEVPDDLRRFAANQRNAGASLSYLTVDGRVLAACAFRDTARPEAKGVIAELRSRGIRTVMVSGDHAQAANAIGAELGLDEVIAGASPERKCAYIDEQRSAGRRVGMVGDGINDAPALARANVAIAVGGGTDVAKETGDLVLSSGGISGVVRAYELSRRTRRGIVQNLFVSLVYNAIGIPLAAGVGAIFWPTLILPPSFAALAMVLSDFSVAANSLRLARELRDL